MEKKWGYSIYPSRTDVFESDDIPEIPGIPNDENVILTTSEKSFEGKKLFQIMGDLYSTEWVNSGSLSPCIKRDRAPSSVHFIIDNEGNKISGDELLNSGKWLWFKPEVIPTLMKQRGGSLKWSTKDTGQVSCSPGYSVHFGTNEIDFINVLAKDIGLLPEWQQKIWGGYNISPEGGVSNELLASQIKAMPANTQASEKYLPLIRLELNSIFKDKFGVPLFTDHEITPSLLTNAHRFRAIDKNGLYALAKDLARLTADSFDRKTLHELVSIPNKNLGSLKSLEYLLGTVCSKEQAKECMGPLHGIYNLRLADAHLPSSELESAFTLLQVVNNYAGIPIDTLLRIQLDQYS